MSRSLLATVSLSFVASFAACESEKATPPPVAPAAESTSGVDAALAEPPALSAAEEEQLNARLAELEAEEPERPDDPCKRSGSCRREGRCTFVDGECAVMSVEDCAGSGSCSTHGRCALQGDTCVATTDTCAAWESCPQPGKCVLDGDHCGLDPAFCQRSDGCAKRGLCTPVDFVCKATTLADCKGSGVCKKQGFCWPGEGPFAGMCVNKMVHEQSKTGEYTLPDGTPNRPTLRKLMESRGDPRR